MENIYYELTTYIDKTRVLENEPMSNHTTFKIGGPADFFVIVNDVQELQDVLKVAKDNNLHVTCIGNGSNLLVKDKGIRGITIKLNFKDIEFNNEEVTAGAGVLLPVIARKACDAGLTGFEFAAGIPGTIGGAVKMNAGAYGSEFKDIVISTTYIDENLKLHTINNDEHDFSYRNSKFSNTNDIIISTKLALKKGDKDSIKEKMEQNSLRRKEKQPINFPNAGSIFKRKNEYIASEIIDKCGLKGYNIGDAYVSSLHAGFIVNKGNASAKDVLDLIEHVKNVVHREYGINLELEIKVIGE